MSQAIETRPSKVRAFARRSMGLALVGAGVSHLTVARGAFQAQVPNFVPISKDTTVVLSGFAEVVLGMLLAFAGRRRRGIGTIAALFFVAVFPGNVSQFIHQRSAFGLDTDTKRFARLFVQPVLVATAIWSTRR